MEGIPSRDGYEPISEGDEDGNPSDKPIAENEGDETNLRRTMESISTSDENKDSTNEGSISEGSEESVTNYESCYTVNVFLFFLTSFQLINLLTLTYTDSVLNYIAKRFQIPNTMASFIPSAYQVGSMVAILPVSHFGAKWHRPRAICIGVMLMILGLGFCILPHFILPSDENENFTSTGGLCERTGVPKYLVNQYRTEFEKHNITFPPINQTILEYLANWHEEHSSDDTEKHKKTSWITAILQSLAAYYHASDKVIKPSLTTPLDLPCNANGTTYNPSVLLIIGHIIIGAGSSPLWPLGVAYLDDHIVSRKMPLYLGIFIGTTLTGPVAGFLLGSLSSAIYVTIDSHNLTPSDPAWIGAWWLGYVIAGGALVVLLIPFYFFPESLKVTEEKLKEREETQALEVMEASMAEEARASRSDDGSTTECNPRETIALLCEDETNRQRICRTIRDFCCSIRRLLSLPLVLCCFLAYIILANLLSGVSTFGSTFMQQEFNILRITSDMLIGGVCVPLAIAGTFSGGFIMKKFEFSTNQSLLFNTVMACSGTVFLTILFGLGCETPATAGVNTRYYHETYINITTACNSDCGCSEGEMNLVCSKANVTYISPCYAGCMDHIQASKDGTTKESFTDCSCVDPAYQPLHSGACKVQSCGGQLAGGILAAALGIFILCHCQAPTYTILLRVLSDDDKPMAIGLLTFLSRILAFIPAPIWFALVIDTSCIYWGAPCHGKSVCKLYNNRGLRINFVGACVSCSLCYSAVFASCLAWFIYSEYFSRNKDYVDDELRHITSRDAMRKRLARMRSFTR